MIVKNNFKKLRCKKLGMASMQESEYVKNLSSTEKCPLFLKVTYKGQGILPEPCVMEVFEVEQTG